MTPEKWIEVKEIFNEAVELSAEEREKFLAGRTNGDDGLRQAVENLLVSDKHAETLFDVAALLAPKDFSADEQIGNYRIVKKIGEGGMGAVFLATRADVQQKVALKIIRRGADSDVILKRFRREQEILAALEHPNIARLIDVGVSDAGVPFLAMEYVEGLDLTTYIHQVNLSVNEKLILFRKICGAVSYAHSRLVVHRDLKPSNIIVSDAGEPKLLDFGISKLITDTESAEEKGTVTSLGMLTPNYASPEQFRGETVSTSTDVYSLGVLLFELLTDALPYEITGKRIDEVARAVIETNPQKPSEAVGIHTDNDEHRTTGDEKRTTNDGQNRKSQIANRKSLRGDIDNIILKALRKEPARRYSSVEQFSEDLRRHLEGLPVTARPDTFSYRAEKFIGRNRASVAAAALVFLILSIAVVGISRQYLRAERERESAERRFADVRELANAFVFKYHDEIQNLPGSTKLREMLVADALTYLNRLAADNTGDVSLKIELAQAFMKIGDVQGQAYDANLGDTAGAIKSYARAVRLLEDAAAENSNDLKTRNELMAAYQKYSSMLSRGGDAQSVEYAEKAVALGERLLQAQPADNDQRIKLAGSYLYLGDSLISDDIAAERTIEIYCQGLEITETVYQNEPENPVVLRRITGLTQRLGFRYFMLAQAAVEIGKPERAAEFYRASLPFYQRSHQAAEKQFALDAQNAVHRRTLSATKLNLSQVRRELGDTDTALAAQLEVLEEMSNVATADAANYEAQSDLASVHDDAALTYAKSKDYANAFRHFWEAQRLLDGAIKNDPNNIEFWKSRRNTTNRLGDALLAKGDYDDALQIYRSAFEQIKAAPMLQDAASQQFFAGEMYEKLGDAQTIRADIKIVSAPERAARLQTARSDYQKAVESWRQSECWKKHFETKPERFDFVSKKLADCEAQMTAKNLN